MMNPIVWFDIPVKNLDRALHFYSKVLNIDIKKEPMGCGGFMGLFSHQGNAVVGCLYESETINPSEHGPLLYFNVNGRISEIEKLIPDLDGTIIEPLHAIGPFGFRIITLDSEGNRIALHSNSNV